MGCKNMGVYVNGDIDGGLSHGKCSGDIVVCRCLYPFSINNPMFGLSSFAPYQYHFMDMYGNIT